MGGERRGCDQEGTGHATASRGGGADDRIVRAVGRRAGQDVCELARHGVVVHGFDAWAAGGFSRDSAEGGGADEFESNAAGKNASAGWVCAAGYPVRGD